MGPNLKMNKSIFCLKITEIYVGKKNIKNNKTLLIKKKIIIIIKTVSFSTGISKIWVRLNNPWDLVRKLGSQNRIILTSCRYKIWEDRPILLYILFRLRHVTCTTPTTSLEQPTSLPVSKGKRSGQSQWLTFLHEKLICSPQDFTN